MKQCCLLVSLWWAKSRVLALNLYRLAQVHDSKFQMLFHIIGVLLMRNSNSPALLLQMPRRGLINSHAVADWIRIALCVFAVTSCARANQRFDYLPVEADNTVVAQFLLPLVHSVEVQQEIGINDKNREQFEKGLRELDQLWWPSRVLKADEQRAVVTKLEPKLLELVDACCGKAAVKRLQQMELQAQSARIMARPDVINYLSLSPTQVRKLRAAFSATDKLAESIQPQAPDPALMEQIKSSRESELREIQTNLTPDQLKSLPTLLGKIFESRELRRIYPLAPNFLDTANVIGTGQFDWSKLKGKVVLVHFYAFECHNCHANFPIYKRWFDKLNTKGVELIGIQTPETSNEKDLSKVVEAADQQGFKFPVIVDLNESNWKAWGNTMWPTVYVVDKNGYIRMWWQGELQYQGATGDRQIEKLVEQLLGEQVK